MRQAVWLEICPVLRLGNLRVVDGVSGNLAGDAVSLVQRNRSNDAVFDRQIGHHARLSSEARAFCLVAGTLPVSGAAVSLREGSSDNSQPERHIYV